MQEATLHYQAAVHLIDAEEDSIAAMTFKARGGRMMQSELGTPQFPPASSCFPFPAATNVAFRL